MSVQRLNYAPKAIIELRKMASQVPPGCARGIRYLLRKMDAAQAFILPDGGHLTDRSKAHPDVPDIMLKPAFPSVLGEYTVTSAFPMGAYSTARSSRRIFVAWEWDDTDRPSDDCPSLPPGVAIASVSHLDTAGGWTPMMAAIHLAYEGSKVAPEEVDLNTRFLAQSIASGRSNASALRKSARSGALIPILPEGMDDAAATYGADVTLDAAMADLNDEVEAYIDLCMALACRNVRTEIDKAPKALNSSRRASGKPPLFEYHVLKLSDGIRAGAHVGAGEKGSPRAHLRRGHIRRLPGDRVTWVNQTMVSGRGGFLDKAYQVEARA